MLKGQFIFIELLWRNFIREQNWKEVRKGLIYLCYFQKKTKLVRTQYKDCFRKAQALFTTLIYLDFFWNQVFVFMK